MTAVAILPNSDGGNGAGFLAISGRQHSVGRTAGEALDALNAQLDESVAGTLVIVQAFQPDRFFSAQQRQRLDSLMSSWRRARDAGAVLPPDDQQELEALIEAELKAAGQRAEALEDVRRP